MRESIVNIDCGTDRDMWIVNSYPHNFKMKTGRKRKYKRMIAKSFGIKSEDMPKLNIDSIYKDSQDKKVK